MAAQNAIDALNPLHQLAQVAQDSIKREWSPHSDPQLQTSIATRSYITPPSLPITPSDISNRQLSDKRHLHNNLNSNSSSNSSNIHSKNKGKQQLGGNINDYTNSFAIESNSNGISQQKALQNPCMCSKNGNRIPRPRNAFILYRQKYHASVVGEFKGKSNPEISKIIGQRWRALTQDEKNYWIKLSEEEKKEHSRKYPDYRYQPRRVMKNKTSHGNVFECVVCNGYITKNQPSDNSNRKSSPKSTTNSNQSFKGNNKSNISNKDDHNRSFHHSVVTPTVHMHSDSPQPRYIVNESPNAPRPFLYNFPLQPTPTGPPHPYLQSQYQPQLQVQVKKEHDPRNISKAQIQLQNLNSSPVTSTTYGQFQVLQPPFSSPNQQNQLPTTPPGSLNSYQLPRPNGYISSPYQKPMQIINNNNIDQNVTQLPTPQHYFHHQQRQSPLDNDRNGNLLPPPSLTSPKGFSQNLSMNNGSRSLLSPAPINPNPLGSSALKRVLSPAELINHSNDERPYKIPKLESPIIPINKININGNDNLNPKIDLTIKEKADLLIKNLEPWRKHYNEKSLKKTLLISIEGENTVDFSRLLAGRLSKSLLTDTPFTDPGHPRSPVSLLNNTTNNNMINDNNDNKKDFNDNIWKISQIQQLISTFDSRSEDSFVINGYLIRICDELSECSRIPSSSHSSSDNDWDLVLKFMKQQKFYSPDVIIYLDSSNRLMQGEVSSFELFDESKLFVTGSQKYEKTIDRIVSYINSFHEQLEKKKKK